jgi:microcystin-dependent protein
MSPFIGEIRAFGFGYAPRGWALCDGQLLPIEQNTALFSVIGTMYGGDGRTTFALPDLRGRAPLHAGHGPGLTPYVPGERIGTATVRLTEREIPAHGHELLASPDAGELQAPASDRALARSTGGFAYRADAAGELVAMDPRAVAASGSGIPHDNMPPVLVVSFCIALQGVYPPRPS